MIEGTAIVAGHHRSSAGRVFAGLLACLGLAAMLVSAPLRADDLRVDALAASLHHSPSEIFAYLRDQVGIDLYSGSLRGPRGTIASKAGSPLDRAALAVALLRASGFTAHFAQGTLSNADAQRVVASTFPRVVRALGCYNPGGINDVVNDYRLNAFARAHTWVEYKPTPASAFVAFDPTFADATLGTANATPATTFDDIPDAQMQKVRFRVTAEIYTQAGALYGFPIGTQTVLDQTFNAADLVDKPVTIGHFTSQTTLPTPTITASTNTYSPYLAVGDSSVDPRDYTVTRGTDYSETLTNFPLGSSILTGVFVDIDVIDPADPSHPQTTRRTLVDRIGYAKRATGGVVTYSPSPDNGPALTPLDLVTIQVAPSKQPLDDFQARHDRMVALQAEAASIAPSVAALPAPGSMSPDDVALATRAVALNRAMAIAVMELATASFEGGAGVAMDRLAALYLVRPTIASPRLTIARTSLAGNSLAFSLDIRRNALQVYTLPGIGYRNVQHFEHARGLSESVLEGVVMQSITGTAARTIASLFDASRDPAGYLPLTSVNRADIDGLKLSDDAKARIGDAIDAGRVVLAPRAPVSVGGTPLTAWLESDPNTGQTISTFEDGTHGALTEYAAIYFERFGEQSLENTMAKFVGNVNSIGVVSIAYMSGLIDSIAANAEFRDSFVNTKEIIEEVMDNALKPILQGLKILTAELELEGPYSQAFALIDGLFEGIETFEKGLELALGDPPVPAIMLAPPDPALPAPVVPGASPGVSVTLTPDPRFVVATNGAELPSVFLAQVTNTGPATDTFRFYGAGSDYPFGNPSQAPILTLGPGATGELNVCLVPFAALPAAGTTVNFTVQAQSTTNPAIVGTSHTSFPTPAAQAASLRILPAGANIAAGASTSVTLTIDSLGNTPTTVALSAVNTPGLTLAGLPASIALVAGESRSLDLTYTVAAGTPSATLLTSLVDADFGGTAPSNAAFAATVTSATTQCTVDAAAAANNLLRTAMGASLARLAGAMDALRASPADAANRQAVITELDYLVAQQFNAPYLAGYATSIGTLRTSLAAANPSAVPDVLTQVDGALCDLGTTLATSTQRNFSLTLAPSSATNLPDQATSVNITIGNSVAVPRVFDITVGGVPAHVTATVNTPTVTVPASYQTNGCCGSPALKVTFSNDDGVARAFDYTITATPRDQPATARTVHGQLQLRNDLVRVVDVEASPAYGDAGTMVSATVHAMDSLNAPAQIYADWDVRDRDNVVRAYGQLAKVSVASGQGLFDFPAFNVNTTGFADGTYTINITLRSASPCCDAIPGGTGQGAFIVGVPFSALLTVAPQDVPPGDSDVQLALTLSHDSLPTPSIVPRGALALPAAARSIAESGLYLYACQEDRVSIIDVSDADNPASVGTFATDVLANGYSNVACNVSGGTLVLAYSGDTPTSFDTVKVVAYDISGAHATAPVQQNTTPTDLGKLFGGHILFDGTTGYMPTTIFLYNPYSGFIFQQNGNLLQLDFSAPSAPAQLGELFHHFPSPSTDTNDPVYGGPNMIFGVEKADHYVYLPSSTSTGGGTDSGVARLDVVDANQLSTNCPGSPNPCIVATRDIPEARLLFGVARQGNTLVVAGDTQGYYDARSGLTGFMTVSAFDITDPSNPVLRSTLVTAVHNRRPTNTCGSGGDPGGATLTALDQQFYAVGGYNTSSCSWVMTLVDASDPDHLRVIPYDITDVLTSTLLDGSTLYAVTQSGIIAYDYRILTGPAITASVDMAKGNGVGVIPGSFNLAPTSVDTSAPDFDRYTWVQPSLATITWQAHLTGMDPGETRDVARGGLIDFTLPAIGAGSLPLDAVAVVSDQAMTIAPGAQNAGLGQPASYVISFANGASTPATYTLGVAGIDPAWVLSLPSPVTVPANGSATATLVLQSGLGDNGGSYPFVVNAAASGWSTSARATLNVDGYNRPIGFDNTAPAFGVATFPSPQPALVGRGGTVRVTLHTVASGTQPQNIYYQNGGTPPGWGTTFETNSQPVAPGSAVDIVADIATPPGVAPGAYQVGVDLYAGAGYVGRIMLDVTVVDAGVTLALVPSAGTPATPFKVTVTNTGANADTFDLAALNALGPAVSFDTNPVVLAAGASANVTATLGDVAYLPAGSGIFDVVATSRANPAATARARATVTLAADKGLALEGIPTSIVVPSAPATRTFALRLHNAGNVEDSYSLAIVGTTGAVSAALRDLASAPVQSLAPLTLPGQALGQFALDATLASGGVGTVTVRATSQTSASLHADVTLTLSAGAAPQLAVAPGTLPFGNQALGTTSATQSATLTNNGGVDVTIATLTPGGANAGDFALASGANACSVPVTLAANGGSCTIYATFTPTAAGARSATITAADALAANTATLSLSGTGVAPDTCFSGNVPGGIATACFTGGGATCQYASAAFIALEGDAASPPPGSAPAGFTFPFGLFQFTTTGCVSGGNLAFTIDYPSALSSRTVYYKYASPDGVLPPQWFTIPASVTGRRVAFSLPSGNITDPGGPAFPADAPPPPPAPVVPVPALRWPALLLLALGLLTSGILRRRRTPNRMR